MGCVESWARGFKGLRTGSDFNSNIHLGNFSNLLQYIEHIFMYMVLYSINTVTKVNYYRSKIPILD